MKTKIFITVLLLMSVMIRLSAQDVTANLSDARSSYNSGELDNARFALQESLNGINQAIGTDTLELLPANLGDMQKVDGSDDVTGTNIGFAGLYVGREYQGENTSASFQIVSDSPLMGSLSSMLSMSIFFAADPNQKRIKIDGYKALLTRSEDDEGVVSYDVQMPFSNSLLTFGTVGVSEENSVTAMLDEMPVSDIVKTAE